ncbi:MAG: type IV secretory system conjugative DNA transfer family protein [Anaerolineae bacterium]|nr:type IV secretory system conjugative DNA transfer family protein [Anaerolineae bacterium]
MRHDNLVKLILIGAQTKGQFHMIYGAEGTQALFTGLATQVVYGGCDADTAEFYSKASGTATTDANQDDPNSHLRQRPLLTVDEVITPQVGNCTIFARYVEAGFATQVVLNARLTRFYERIDWKRRLLASQSAQPLLLERGLSMNLIGQFETPEAVSAAEPKPILDRAAAAVMARIAEDARLQSAGKVKFASLDVMRGNHTESVALPEVKP